MSNWSRGYTADELDAAQERYDLRFPPDLHDLLLERQPTEGYSWRRENPAIRRMLDWPYERLRFDLENNGLWWPEWGSRPASETERAEVLRSQLAEAPRLIPLLSHRFFPAEPSLPGNPVI